MAMSAKDLVSHRQFHGTNAELQPGDEVRPLSEVMPEVHKRQNMGRGAMVWTTNRARWAAGFGTNVYQVKHEGLVNPPDEDYGPIPGTHVATGGVKVVKKIKRSTIERLHSAREAQHGNEIKRTYLPK